MNLENPATCPVKPLTSTVLTCIDLVAMYSIIQNTSGKQKRQMLQGLFCLQVKRGFKKMQKHVYKYILYRSIYITWTIKLKVSEKSMVCIALYLQPHGELFRFAIPKQEFRRKSLVVFMWSVHPKPYKIIPPVEKKTLTFVGKKLKSSKTGTNSNKRLIVGLRPGSLEF